LTQTGCDRSNLFINAAALRFEAFQSRPAADSKTNVRWMLPTI
jgi:hypothetical protein